MRKILFCDLDGTIVGRDQKPLHKKNLKAMQKFRDAGNYIALCTGRNNIDLRPTLKITNIPFDYLVLCNGAYITDKDFNVIYQHNVPVDIARSIISSTDEIKDLIIYYCDEQKIVMRAGTKVTELDIKGNHKEITDVSFKAIYENASKFTMLGISELDESHPIDQLVYDVLNPFGNEISWFFNRKDVDIMASPASKGVGLAKLGELLDIDIKDCYAIGDSYNDISMLEVAGKSFSFNYSALDVMIKSTKTVDYLYEAIEDILKE